MNVEIYFDKIVIGEITVKHNNEKIKFGLNDNILKATIRETMTTGLLEIYTTKLVTIKILKFDDYFIINGPKDPIKYYKFDIFYPFFKKYTNINYGGRAGATK